MTFTVRTLRRLQWVAGAFVVFVLIGLTLNAVAVRNADPAAPTKIDELVTRLNQDPNNARLLSEIHREDLWLRQTYLRSQRFSAIGFFLLLGGVSVWLLSAKSERRLKAAAPQPVPDASARAEEQRLRSREGVLATGVSVAAALIAVSAFTRHDAIQAYVLGSRIPQALAVASQPTTVEVQSIPGIASPPPITGKIGPEAIQPPDTTLTPLPTAPTPAKPVTQTAAAAPSSATLAPAPSKPGAWQYFRGPGAGTTTGALPSSWDSASGKGVAWRSDVPLPGWGSPVVSQGLVFLTGATETIDEVYAFDAKTGKLAWSTRVPVLCRTAKISRDSGYAPATAAADDRYVVASFANGDVAGLNRAGKLLWSKSFGPMDNQYGYASCPVLAPGKAIFQLDQGTSPEDGKSRLVAVSPATGKIVWDVKRPVSAAWSTPVVAKLGSKTAIIVCGNPLVMAYDAADGKELWRAGGMGGEVVAGAALGQGAVFVAQMGGQAMALRASDGKVLWANTDLALPDISSPAFANGLVFFTSPDGTLTAVDATSGKEAWEHPMGKPARSSPLIAGGKVLLFGTDGVGRVVEAGRSFKLVASLPLGEAVSASPALVGGRLFVRTEKRLYCLGPK